jgi:hypothetical protein
MSRMLSALADASLSDWYAVAFGTAFIMFWVML